MKEELKASHKSIATGKVVKAFGNLLDIEFHGDIRQGEVATVRLGGGVSLKSEVIEIVGNVAKIQVFEDTRGVRLGTAEEFTTHLLEAELGPGLLTSIVDGLQNPLEKVACENPTLCWRKDQSLEDDEHRNPHHRHRISGAKRWHILCSGAFWRW